MRLEQLFGCVHTLCQHKTALLQDNQVIQFAAASQSLSAQALFTEKQQLTALVQQCESVISQQRDNVLQLRQVCTCLQ